MTKRKLNMDSENFLHSNPALYIAFEPDANLGMAHFIHALLTEYNAGKRVLDIGCGVGREVSYLNGVGFTAIGLDNSPEMVSWAKTHYPDSDFVLGSQFDFSLGQIFDAITCVGSTFLYNFTNESAIASLNNFRKHLDVGGLLYLDMRNAAFFLTAEGQRWLAEELVDQTVFDGLPAVLKTRFRINLLAQILERDYNWSIGGNPPIVEHLHHRLFFPQELSALLSICGFRVLKIFDKPEPHLGGYDANTKLSFGNDLFGRRMQIIAQAT
jgi:SAM-dependent methyltransferase